MWTQFMDMHSGGGAKEEWEYIYIEAPEKEAAVIFYNRFGHSPFRVTCTCCGADYATTEASSLEQVTAFERGCMYDQGSECYLEKGGADCIPVLHPPYRTLDEYLKSKDILVIREAEIRPEEKSGTLPIQGYVWQD